MKKIDLKEYKSYKTYFILFDILMKERNERKEDVLKELSISVSSYRRAHFNDTKISKELYIKLCNYFKIVPLNLKDIDSLEEKINESYLNIYYGINNDSVFKWLTEQKNKRNVLFPIFELLEQYYNYEEFFSDINDINYLKYKNFYHDELFRVYKIFEIALSDELYDAKNFNYTDDFNEHYLSALALNSFKNGKNIESIYYSEKALDLYNVNLNYKRKYYANIIIMLNLLSLKKYKDCAQLAHKQYYSLKSLQYNGIEFYFTLELFLLSNLYIGNYTEILKTEYESYESILILLIKLFVYKELEEDEAYIKTKNKIKEVEINNGVNSLLDDIDLFSSFDYNFIKKLLSLKSLNF